MQIKTIKQQKRLHVWISVKICAADLKFTNHLEIPLSTYGYKWSNGRKVM